MLTEPPQSKARKREQANGRQGSMPQNILTGSERTRARNDKEEVEHEREFLNEEPLKNGTRSTHAHGTLLCMHVCCARMCRRGYKLPALLCFLFVMRQTF